jgi:hypothetical protein
MLTGTFPRIWQSRYPVIAILHSSAFSAATEEIASLLAGHAVFGDKVIMGFFAEPGVEFLRTQLIAFLLRSEIIGRTTLTPGFNIDLGAWSFKVLGLFTMLKMMLILVFRFLGFFAPSKALNCLACC